MKLAIYGSLVIFMISSVGAVMKCPLLRFNEGYLDEIADRYVNNCPRIGQSEYYQYCCYNEKLEARCCELNEFLMNMSVFAVVILVILLLVSTLVSCFCCFCCPCCFLYKRRRAGRENRPPYPDSNIRLNPPEYKPLTKSHLPPGAYPVLPPTADVRNYRSQP